ELRTKFKPILTADKRNNHHITGECDNNNHQGEENKAPFSFGKPLPKLIHGLVAFSLGFSMSAFNENVSRLSRPRLEGALNPTFSKSGERSRRGINADAFSALPWTSKYPPR